MKRPPLLLIVLDGWGHREAADHNAIRANAPYWHELLAKYPHSLLSASGKEVGLPLGLMGNSEVGHLNLGAGRVVYQDQTRIHKSIDDGDFFENGAFVPVFDRIREEGKKLHLMGLVGTGGVHASNKHIKALLEMAARQGLDEDQVVVHAIMDGRDTPPRSGAEFLEDLQDSIGTACVGRIGSVIGRYWAMDRDKRWERVQRAFDLLVRGEGQLAATAAEAIGKSYESDTGDEFCEPFVIGTDRRQDRLEPGDALLCFNFRADRMREITEALGHHSFDGFDRGDWPVPKAGQTPRDAGSLEMVTMTQYRDDLPFAVAFPPTSLVGIFPELISAAGLRQERIAETEKYAHVTFFFSGGVEAPVEGESRILIPSPRVATYDLQPEMSAPGITAAILKSLEAGETDVYIINYANADMVGHTGIPEAAAAAVRTVDDCLAKIVPAVTAKGGLVAITADHGNVEMMWDEVNNQPHTAHTTNPVPIVFCSDSLIGQSVRPMGILADVAPTLLQVLGLDKSPGMDGQTLFTG
ncbi:MAG: 2,3-bisphosphoglycerate-independent phosphoglycerate mutase [Planctomycetota bacterium]|nr:2,3-bisphosphoglycerate-independent phosphoglycerate mutase [Planctomycetota bacterium]